MYLHNLYLAEFYSHSNHLDFLTQATITLRLYLNSHKPSSRLHFTAVSSYLHIPPIYRLSFPNQDSSLFHTHHPLPSTKHLHITQCQHLLSQKTHSLLSVTVMLQSLSPLAISINYTLAFSVNSRTSSLQNSTR